MALRDVHIAGFAQLPNSHDLDDYDEAEMVQEITERALADAGLRREDVGFTCSGSNDYVMGRPFSFTMAIDGLGAWPPIRESHVEMDGAWAMYEAYVRLQHGDVDVALVYCFGKSSLGSVDKVHTYELDPYSLAPLQVDPHSLAAMQARMLLEQGLITEAELAHIACRARRDGNKNPNAPHSDEADADALLAQPYVREPLRAHDLPTRTDGAACIVLRVGGGGPRIRGIAHIMDQHQPGSRDLTDAVSARQALEAAGGADGVTVAELHAPYTTQVAVLKRAMGLDDEVAINPSGGAIPACTPMVAGLVRIGEAAMAVRHGAPAAIGHATSGSLLQHNLVCVLEAE
ncbi:MAG: lipid-transfer protein [Deltaproteobacteria bacterium]|nr:MAG: lipid-transfer protein [Deltaproteobacteria bacterium]